MGHGLLQRVVAVRHLRGSTFVVRFEDGAEGEIDVRRLLAPLRGWLAPLANPAYARRAVLTDHGTLEWPNGVELDPVIAYCAATGTPIPDYSRRPDRSGARSRRSTARPVAGTGRRGGARTRIRRR